jgi:hypothetical protein
MIFKIEKGTVYVTNNQTSKSTTFQKESKLFTLYTSKK